jgi:hypothetical protein
MSLHTWGQDKHIGRKGSQRTRSPRLGFKPTAFRQPSKHSYAHSRFRGAELVDAILERQTDLRDGVHGPSQTDLLAVLGLESTLAVLAVEGKVDESFGPLVSEWSTGNEPRRTRLQTLTKLLDLAGQDIAGLRYQLLHRTAAAVYEAERYRAPVALMLVHSFSPRRSGWGGFAAFLQAIGLSKKPTPNEVLGPKRVARIELYAAWLADDMPLSTQSNGRLDL